MVSIGCKVKTTTGKIGHITEFLGRGGEGSAYKIKTSTGYEALKIFHRSFDKKQTEKRLKYLVDNNLHLLSSIFKTPEEIYTNRDEIGYTASFAFGLSLDKYLEKPTGTFADNLVLAITLVYGLMLLHECGIAHGDLHPGNFIVDEFRKVHRLYFIDLDNFHSSNTPKPRMLGNLLYIAPELRLAQRANVRIYPNILCDLYSAGLIIHELLLMHYPENITRKLKEEYVGFVDDIDFGDSQQKGLQENILNPELRRLIHRALSDKPSERPFMHEWLSVLLDALEKIYQCDYCGMPFVNDSSKWRCTSCSREFPVLKLILNNGREIRLDKNGMSILGKHIGTGRDNSEWGTVQKFGCEVSLIPGHNSVYYWGKDGWIRLKEHESFLLKNGGRFLFGNVEGKVVEWE